jgi:hypothetical protein
VGDTLLVILVLAAVMAAIVAVSFFVLRRVGDRAERRADELRGEVDGTGEGWVIPLDGAVYQGGGSPHVRSRGHGVLGLTGRRVVFLPIAGELVSMPRARVARVRMEARRRDAAGAHRHRLVLTLDDGGEMSFLVDDPGEWRETLAPAAPDAPAQAPGEG